MTNDVNRQKTTRHKSKRGRNRAHRKSRYPAYGMAARATIAHAGTETDQETATRKQPDREIFSWLVKIGPYLVEQESTDNDACQKSEPPKYFSPGSID